MPIAGTIVPPMVTSPKSPAAYSVTAADSAERIISPYRAGTPPNPMLNSWAQFCPY